nr:MAG TPA: hypothetical protein [Caudoviricetes sp.]
MFYISSFVTSVMRNKGGRLIDYVCNFREKPFVPV